jgi:hypothetical protein
VASGAVGIEYRAILRLDYTAARNMARAHPETRDQDRRILKGKTLALPPLTPPTPLRVSKKPKPRTYGGALDAPIGGEGLGA